MELIERYLGEAGKRLRFEAIKSQKLVQGDLALAEQLTEAAEFQAVKAGEDLIEQNAEDNDVYFIVSGEFEIRVNDRVLASRTVNDQVGEMAAVEPSQRRSASVRAVKDGIVAKVSEPHFTAIARKAPCVYEKIARDLARRLLERNKWVTGTNDRINVLLISSVEAIGVVREIERELDHDNIFVEPWPNVFRAAHYTLEDLLHRLEGIDFVVAIAQGDDKLESRDANWPAPRDNVIFELGLAMGALGRHRAILLEPRGDGVKLPSDLAGITTVTYKKGADGTPNLGPACTALRKQFEALGAR